MKSKPARKVASESWRTKWPVNGDLIDWLRAILHKCDAIADPALAADKAHLSIKHLAEKSSPDEALRYVNRFLRRLPKASVLPRVRLAKLGAQISLDAGDLERMEKHLAIAEATEPFNTRKCDKGFSLNAVREFRAQNGLLDSADAIDDEQRVKANFERAARECTRAIADGECELAKAALGKMERAARQMQKEWWRRAYLKRVIQGCAELNDAAVTKHFVDALDEQDRNEVLDAEMLLRLGRKAEAIARAQRDIDRRLTELRGTKDPNIHFPVMAIEHSLEWLVEQGARDKARQWLQRTLTEMPNWRVIEYGWLSSSVYHSLGKAVALIDGPAAAEEFVRNAAKDAAEEKRSDFRKGATGAVLNLKAEIGQLEDAIAEARKLRSPTERRKRLGKLLAKARRWSELRDVLREVASPEEAAEVGWWIKFELPGGAAR